MNVVVSMKPVVNNQDDESNCVDGVVEQSMRDVEYQQTVQNKRNHPGRGARTLEHVTIIRRDALWNVMNLGSL